ncbi:hypothetical protein RE6C_03593 [Rhodopirellula europaea 6C]|uniref:Sulfotransferase n=2 Tax=Rhodopirellula TaxID=265488 RepID=M2B1M5_9BACT|nr:hypothetical protein RE6C_03593 [Rhodopirellula europaea 6C]
MTCEAILVTGAPRSGTTPLGNLLSTIPGAFELYEPMGPTGDRRFTTRFPIPGEPGFSKQQLSDFVGDLQIPRLRFKSQRRDDHKGLSGWAARILGTRSLMTYRRARWTRDRKLLIWKDPHAIFCVPALARSGVQAVVSIRSPQAHAASFKRLGWVSSLDEIYWRYRDSFGGSSMIEHWMDRIGDTPWGSATLLWHLVHTTIVQMPDADLKSTILFNLERAAADEIEAYEDLFQSLGHEFPFEARQRLESRLAKKEQANVPAAGKVHDFERTAYQANSYWRDLLNEKELQIINEINANLWSRLKEL